MTSSADYLHPSMGEQKCEFAKNRPDCHGRDIRTAKARGWRKRKGIHWAHRGLTLDQKDLRIDQRNCEMDMIRRRFRTGLRAAEGRPY
jgi:hypothetical protein